MMYLEPARALVDRFDLLPASPEAPLRLGVGVSGGADSMVLLDFLAERAKASPLVLTVLHLDHALREDSADVAAFVREEAARRGIEAHVERVELAPRGNVEGLARRARYAFFAEAARRLGLERIALAHTADDQIETFLDRLLRGSGRGGLSAMRPARPAEGYVLVRPFLTTRRDAVRAAAAARGIPFRDDPMNEDVRFKRVRIRREVLPFLRRHADALDDTLLRTIDVLAEEDAYLEEEAAAAFDRALRPGSAGGGGEGGVALALDALAELPRPILRRLLRRAVHTAAGGAAAAHVHVEALEALLSEGATGGVVHLPLGLEAHREAESLRFLRRSPRGPEGAGEVQLAVPGETAAEFLGLVVRVDLIPRAAAELPVVASARTAFFDAAAVRPPLVLRLRRPGDRIRPMGMRGSKKLQDLFVDEKIPRWRRDRIPVLADGDGLLWVVGVRQAERARVTDATEEVLRVTMRGGEGDDPRDAA